VRAGSSDSAVALFERLTRVDPAFAPGWAALAQAYTERLFQYDPDPRWQERAFVAIERALALDSTLAEAYAARAQLLWTDANGFRAEQAIRDYRRALRANPNLVEAHAGLGRIYMHVCLPDEALVHLRTALALDPASRFAPPRIAGVHLLQGRNDSALAGLEAVDDPSWTAERAAALLRLGRAADAERLLAQAAAASPPPELAVQIAGARSHVLAALGRAAEARRQIRLAQAGERFSHFHHQAFQVAAAWVHLGEADSALTWLERSAAEGLPCHTLFAREPALAPLHALPRYQALLERLRGERERLRLVSRE
jgi:tetratricopeptide (TPR) repeat protein